jgi:hypothetical protein
MGPRREGRLCYLGVRPRRRGDGHDVETEAQQLVERPTDLDGTSTALLGRSGKRQCPLAMAVIGGDNVDLGMPTEGREVTSGRHPPGADQSDSHSAKVRHQNPLRPAALTPLFANAAESTPRGGGLRSFP